MREPRRTKFPDKIAIDIELTNACNARCTFCPRDNMPDIGLINPDVFYKAVERGMEHPGTPYFTFCGTGDALMNKHIVEYARHIRELGCDLRMATNGHLMTEEKAKALIDAGINQVTFSISSRGEKYNKEYGLDYETTHSNILRFIALAKGKCRVRIAMVLHDDTVPYDEDEAYWRSVGVNRFIKYEPINRAGALYALNELPADVVRAARQQLRTAGQVDECKVSYFVFFIGWDGYYYLCSSDWRKQAPVGHVNTHSIEDTMARRRCALESRSPICSQCTSDPVNKLLATTRGPRGEVKLPVRLVS